MKDFLKDPDATKFYDVDWTKWLLDTETITTSAWIIPDGITGDSDTRAGAVATIWLSGGTAGRTYLVTNRVTTSLGRTDDRTIRIFVRDL